MRTKDIVTITGLDRGALRFYEKEGLIPKPKRTHNGYRQFSEDIIDRITFIQKAKGAGFTLREIKELIDLKKRRVSCRKGRDIALAQRFRLQ